MKKRTISTICFLIVIILAASAFTQEQMKTDGQNTSIDQNKKVVLRLFEEVFNKHSLSVIDDLYNPNVVDHSAFPDQPPGVEGIKSAIKGFFGIFDSLEVSVEDIIADGDKVVTREVWRGIHKSSGKTAEGTVIHIFRIHKGKISDEWSRGWDWLANL